MHTPGPWTAHTSSVFADRDCIAICDTDNASKRRYEANARLMAAAPDLLAALQAMLARYAEGNDWECQIECEVMARHAIAKATGAP